jgi:DNA-binding response OmpR family regulator
VVAKAGILLVEDDPDLAALLAKHLRRAGLAVTCCGRADLALERLDTEEWLAAVVDLTLPDLPGAELVRRILARCPGLAIVAISGSPSDPALFSPESPERPRLRFLQKPFAPKDLLEVIGDVRRLAAADQNAP